MDRTVANAAMTLQSIAGTDPLSTTAYYAEFFGPEHPRASCRRCRAPCPNYMSALDLNFVRGKRIGYNGTFDRRHAGQARVRRARGGRARSWSRARRSTSPPTSRRCRAGYQQHKSIDEYYKRLGPSAPIKSLAEEVADNQANAHEALKFGNNSHVNALAADIAPGAANETAYRAACRSAGGPARGASTT